MKVTQYNYQLKKQKQKRFVFIFIFCVIIFIIVNLIMAYLVYPVRQNSTSMTPDVPEQSLVMVSPLSKTYERGDIVLVEERVQSDSKGMKKLGEIIVSFFTARQFYPGKSEKLPGTEPQLRRVVGLPGDTVYMRDYVMYIKPKGERHFLTEFEITPKTYNVTFFAAPAGWDSSIGVKGSFDKIVLGNDEYFVLGDDRKSTDDSRLWGTVTKDKIAAKALLCYFPFKNFKLY